MNDLNDKNKGHLDPYEEFIRSKELDPYESLINISGDLNSDKNKKINKSLI